MNTNRLSAEKSPYLLQHAHQPVDWYPWGDEAFSRAHKEDKPVFLSIGYSTCHWCHVMAHESFDDPAVAGLLNDAFVCIKVDREERPDIDRIYMAACQMLTGSGGWPLTIFLAPDRQPFYAATYLPKESRYGRMGLLDLIPRLRSLWKDRRQEVLKAAAEITAHLSRDGGSSTRGALSKTLPMDACESLKADFDEAFGGFGPAPKFPIPHQLLFLLHYSESTGDRKGRDMASRTLEAMRRGGIYDQIGFGFHRYSTDREWLVPHFEKMLYDQALLALAYLEALQATGQTSFGTAAREIFTYVLRDMTAPEGGFYCAEDADSEREEGKFYVWTADEVRQTLTAEESRLIITLFGVEEAGNYREEVTKGKTGRNILHMQKSWAEMASETGLPASVLCDRLEVARQKLFAERKKRIHPHKDDKILTDWNGLMIAALCRGAQVLDEPRYQDQAKAALAFIFKDLVDESGRLLHRWREGEAAGPALIDDYAFLIWGLLECYEASFDPLFLKRAMALQEQLDARFWDGEQGGYYFSPDDGERIITRQKESYDGAVPSGNAVAMMNLIRLSRMTGHQPWEERAERLGEAFAGNISRLPAAHAMFMNALTWMFGDSCEIVMVGDPDDEELRKMLSVSRRVYLPNKVMLLKNTESVTSPDITELAPFTKEMTKVDGRATAYLCSNRTCQPPITDLVQLEKILSGYRRNVHKS